MLPAITLIAIVLLWLAFNALAETLDHISNETAKAHGFTSTDGEGDRASGIAGGGGGRLKADPVEVLESHSHNQSNRTGQGLK